tara:strand:- start:5827 stop:6039 length:213 start_codon:yes stop_codon:yes gene_type:complete
MFSLIAVTSTDSTPPYGQFIQPRGKLFGYLVLVADCEINSRQTVTHFGKAKGFQVQFLWSVRTAIAEEIE